MVEQRFVAPCTGVRFSSFTFVESTIIYKTFLSCIKGFICYTMVYLEGEQIKWKQLKQLKKYWKLI